ncbi:MAG: hypothetical protein NTY11_01860 [Candidatus Parcubacteria bacterium]|nr:hypothetical protein [Candidatus Parcubacteria bacterium]
MPETRNKSKSQASADQRELTRQDRFGFKLAKVPIGLIKLLLRSPDFADSAVGTALRPSFMFAERATHILAHPDERPVLLDPLLQAGWTFVGRETKRIQPSSSLTLPALVHQRRTLKDLVHVS